MSQPKLGLESDRIWTEESAFFSDADLLEAKTDTISEWVKGHAEPGDKLASESGIRITIRHYER